MGRLEAEGVPDVHHQGLRFVATDADWSVGEGDEVRGPLMAIVLMLTGRPVGADALDGPGAARLGRRPVVADGPATRQPIELTHTTEEEA